MTDKEKIKLWAKGRLFELMNGTGEKDAGSVLTDLLSFIDSMQEEHVSEDLEEACNSYYDETWDEHGGRAMVVDGCHDIWFPSHATDEFFKAGANWKKEQIEEVLLSKVLPCFMHGGEADEVVAKLDEVLNQKK